MAFTGASTVSDLVIVVRETLQDMSGERYSDDRIIRALNLGILNIRDKRPDYWIGMYQEPTWLATNLTETIPLPQTVLNWAVVYATGWVEMADDEYTTDGRAAAFLAKFESDLK